MTLTFVGLAQAVIGLLLLVRGSLPAMFVFLACSGLFGGSAAILLPALSGSSIPPTEFALLFLFLRILMPRGGYAGALPSALKANAALAFYTVYGVVAAFLAPRIFAGTISVAPLRSGDQSDLFYVERLFPSAQNITTAVYLVGALMLAVAAHVVCTYRGGPNALVRGGVFIAWAHGMTGLFFAIFAGVPAVEAVLDLFRNASYAQLSQSYQGFVRIAGFYPEASGWAAFGFAWFVFNAECWYRGILARSTGIAALMLAALLFFSTSSTAYISLALYVVFFVLRALLVPGASSIVRLRQAAIAGFATLFLTAVAMALIPAAMAAVVDVLDHMLFDKADSHSGQQRLFWAMQGWDAFLHSRGLGIGPGSFRSSSLLMAVLGSMGVIGVVTFLIYLWRVWRPDRLSSWGKGEDVTHSVGGAAACAAILSLIPAAISAPSPVPPIVFALLSGAALAMRREDAGDRSAAARDGAFNPLPGSPR